MTATIEVPREAIAEFCKRWRIVEFSLFGSVLRDDFCPDSDIDVLIEFEKGDTHTLFDLVQMEDELQSIFRRKVDLLTKRAVETSRNYLRRKKILDTAEVTYAL
ncbi:MAG: nucleotidyltransferase family protein [Deltaproteobacteria bacterium]|nr:nucleotidyltransferase family protein [Deltaproteobacteria bacterium]